MAAFTVLLFPVLISFAFWQLDREQQKIRLQMQYDERASAPPVNITDIDWSSQDLGWMHVMAIGRFDSSRQFMLDNRIADSKVGYEVITPFITEAGTLFVNRGWVAQGQTRADLPNPPAPETESVIRGHIYVPEGETLMFGTDNMSADNWPVLIQRVDMAQMAAVAGIQNNMPHIVRLTAESAGVLQTNWSAINMRPETHRAYAIQWFVMATVLLILFVIFSFRKPEI